MLPGSTLLKFDRFLAATFCILRLLPLHRRLVVRKPQALGINQRLFVIVSSLFVLQ